MLPADASGKVDWQSGDGTGPYRIVSHEPGVGTRLARHDGYHRDGLAHFAEVHIIALNDSNARQSALLTGEVDALSETDVRTVGLLARNPAMKVVEVASGTHPTIPMHIDFKPFDSLDLRLALKYAINRQEMVDKILFGHGSVGNDNPVSPAMPFYHALPARPYDPDRARFHLKKAGMEGVKLTLSSSDAAFSGALDLALLYRESAAAAGLDITVQREPADGYWSEVWLKKPFSVASWGGRPTPDVIFSLAYKAGAPWNESRWNHPRFNDLLVQGRAELDAARRTAIYAEMQTLVYEEGATVIPFFRNRVNAMSAKVGTPLRMAGNYEADGARSFQRWWFQS
jgi:peptide/nickel transport system substrate-binding protein